MASDPNFFLCKFVPLKPVLAEELKKIGVFMFKNLTSLLHHNYVNFENRPAMVWTSFLHEKISIPVRACIGDSTGDIRHIDMTVCCAAHSAEGSHQCSYGTVKLQHAACKNLCSGQLLHTCLPWQKIETIFILIIIQVD